MAGELKKISDLTAGTPLDTDVIPYVDLVTNTTKKALKSELKGDKGDTGDTGVAGADGDDGADGANAYVYIAYASDNSGTNFTTTFNSALDYIAIKTTTTEIVSPSASDFTGLWKNYKGATGAAGLDGACVESVAFVGNDMVFTLDDASTVTLTDAKITLKGDAGDAGANGTDGTDGVDGTDGISFIWEGAYVAETTYAINDVVSYQGSSYICILNSTGNLPTDDTYWSLMAQKGLDGEGAGDVVGPASATDNNIAVFDGITGKIIKDGGATIASKQNALTFGIADTNAVKIDSADVADDEFARFTANGLESRSNSEIKIQLGYIENVVDDTTPKLGGQLDVNGNAIGDGSLELLKFEETASAVNEITIKNNSTGNAPEVQATGDDTNIDLKLVPKGTGIVKGETHTATFVLKDKDTSLAIGTSIGGDFRIPGNRAITVKKVGAYTDTASATGSNKLTIDINEAGTSILSTKITLDVGEKTSQTASTAPVISDASIAADAIITFDIDQVNETTPDKGLKVYIEFIYA